MSSSFAIDIPATTIAQLRRGDARAFEQIYRLFERPVYSLAWRMLGDPDEAREVLHDTLLQVFERVAQFRGESPFWGWLRQIAVNQALMCIRKRRLDYVDEVPEPEMLMRTLDPAIAGVDLERALHDVPVLTRSVLWLYFVEGYTHEEIARAFDRTVSFSKTQVSRGTEKLRHLLDVGREALAYAT
jgi:RNA polymerase sigma factor (sigma-70 family)